MVQSWRKYSLEVHESLKKYSLTNNQEVLMNELKTIEASKASFGPVTHFRRAKGQGVLLKGRYIFYVSLRSWCPYRRCKGQ